MAGSKLRTSVKVSAVVLMLGGLTYVGLALLQSDVAGRSVSIGSVDVSRMTRSQVLQQVNTHIVEPAQHPFAVQVLEQSFALEPETSGLSIDTAATVEQVVARTWNPVALFDKYFGNLHVEPIVKIDSVALKDALTGISDSLAVAPDEPAITFKGERPVLAEGKSGVIVDLAGAHQVIATTFARINEPPILPTRTVAPTVSQQRAMTFLRNDLPQAIEPIQVVIGKDVVTLPKKAMRSALSFRGLDGTMQPVVDGDALLAQVRKQLPELGTPAQDAYFRISHGKPYIVPEKPGRGVTAEELATSVTPLVFADAPRKATISLAEIAPEFTAEQAKSLGIVEKLSSFTQNFPYAPYRVTNIGQAAKYLNNTIVMPGETFSMNDTVKERTVANGYTKGFIIGAGGQFREDLGGGVSTATTAVWTAAFFANMERVEQRAHSFWISRYRPGLEATVSWGSLDMRWRNPLKTAVLIKASITNSSVTVTLYGTKTFDEVRAVSSPWRNIRPYSTVYNSDPLCVGQDGVNGFDITVTRQVVKDKQIVKTDNFVTSYSAGPHVICGKQPEATG